LPSKDSSHTLVPFRFSQLFSRILQHVRRFLPLDREFLSCLSTRDKPRSRPVRPISAYPNLNCVYPHLVHFRCLAKVCTLVERTCFGTCLLCRWLLRFTTQKSLRWVTLSCTLFGQMPKSNFTVPLTPLSLPSIPCRWPSPRTDQIEGCQDYLVPIFREENGYP